MNFDQQHEGDLKQVMLNLQSTTHLKFKVIKVGNEGLEINYQGHPKRAISTLQIHSVLNKIYLFPKNQEIWNT